MTMATATHDLPSQDTWFQRAEAWLDQRGKPAWITAMVLGFIFFWPIGLAFLAYMIWRKPMLCHARSSRRNKFAGHGVNRSSGNAAFDSYKEATLDRLHQEQEEFHAFMERLRAAKDKAEFDQLMSERETKVEQ